MKFEDGAEILTMLSCLFGDEGLTAKPLEMLEGLTDAEVAQENTGGFIQ